MWKQTAGELNKSMWWHEYFIWVFFSLLISNSWIAMNNWINKSALCLETYYYSEYLSSGCCSATEPRLALKSSRGRRYELQRCNASTGKHAVLHHESMTPWLGRSPSYLLTVNCSQGRVQYSHVRFNFAWPLVLTTFKRRQIYTAPGHEHVPLAVQIFRLESETDWYSAVLEDWPHVRSVFKWIFFVWVFKLFLTTPK